MSRENIELVRRVFDSINQGDSSRALEEAASDFAMDWSNSIGPAKGVYRGRQQVQDLWASYLDAFSSLEWNPEEFIEVDESRLVVVNRNRARGRGSGVEVDAVGAQLWTIHDGKAQSVKLYRSKADALEAAERSE